MTDRCLVVADYGQLEPRLMAHFSQDPRLLAVYTDGKGDIYQDMAFSIFGDGWTKEHRGLCKTLVLAMGYGAGDKKIGSILTANGFPTDESTGAKYLSDLRNTYPTFFEWREQVAKQVHRDGYVTAIGGRRRRLKAQFADVRNYKLVGYGERQAVNANIQASAADIVRRTMVHTSADSTLSAFAMVAQVHDELIWEVAKREVTPRALRRIQWHGEVGHGYALSVPLLFVPHVGTSWAEGKAL